MRLRPRRVPAEVRAVDLDRGERRVGWALTTDGAAVVATEGAVVLPQARVAWTQVERATWQPPRLEVRALADAEPYVEGAGPAYVVELAEPGDLAEVVRARVTAGVAWSQRVAFAAGGAARLVARRVGDDLQWQVVYDRGTDVEAVRVEAEQALLRARAAVG